MSDRHNPQREQMSDESMLRNLAAQAEAIWPQELPLIERYLLPAGADVLDVGCGPGEIAERLLAALPSVRVLGVDVDDAHVDRARTRCARFGDRAAFEHGDAVELDLGERRFDLAMCRHVLQAIPHADRVLANLVRATRPGGRLHVVAEDYGMMHFHPAAHDIDEFWREGPVRYAASLGTDLLNGRKIYSMLRALDLADVRVDYIVVDTVRVSREVFARIWTAWRDGYADVVSRHSGLSREHVLACFEDMIACIRDPDGYAVWQLPVVTGTVPA